MHARPICSCLAPARSSGKFCHFPLFSRQLQEVPHAHSTNPSEGRDLRKTATPKPFCLSSFQSSCQLPSVTCSRRQGQKASGLCDLSLLWLSGEDALRVKHMTLRASFLQSQAPGQPASAGTNRPPCWGEVT